MRQPTHNAVPLLLGVTGHQDIDPKQLDALRTAVHKVVQQLRKDYPHTPLVLLSPLVPGADRLVAETVVDLSAESDIDIHLVPVLPWPRERGIGEDCRDDGPAIDDLLANAQQTVTLPLPEGVTQGHLRNDPEAQEAQREQAGRYIARHCQILLALWDGDTTETSHTARVVDWHSRGGKAPFTVRVGELDTVEGAAVCHLPVRRIGQKTEQLAAEAQGSQHEEFISPIWLYPTKDASTPEQKPPKGIVARFWFLVRLVLLAIHRLPRMVKRSIFGRTPAGERQLKERWLAIDRFNRDIAPLPDSAANDLQTSRGYLIPENEVDQLPEPVRRLRDIYALADISAGRYQNRVLQLGLQLFGIALCAVAALEIYAHLWHEWPVLLIYLVLLASGYLLFQRARRKQIQGRWLDDRALAEALRVQVYWSWAGLGDCVADHYLRHFRGEFDWIRHATRALFLISGGHVTAPVLSADEVRKRLQSVHTCWIRDQYNYFSTKAPLNSELEACFETGAKLAFAGAIVVTCCLLWYHLATHHMSHALVLGTFGCLVAAAMLDEYAELQTYALLGRRYRWMADLYGNAMDRIEPLITENKTTQVKNALFELGCEALTENADWVIQHRQRPPVLPKG